MYKSTHKLFTSHVSNLTIDKYFMSEYVNLYSNEFGKLTHLHMNLHNYCEYDISFKYMNL